VQSETLAGQLIESTNAAIRAKPHLAAAYFLRGWAGFQSKPQSPDWIADIQKAAQLDPREALYADSLRFLSISPTSTPSVSGPVGLPNPASVNCTRNGGRLLPQVGHGGEFSYCVFPDGSSCEEWAYFRGDCSPGAAWSVTPTPLAAARIEFSPNSIGAEVKGKLAPGETRVYVLRAMQGQTMSANLESTNGAARLSIRGATDGGEYLGRGAESPGWTGRLPSTQDYVFTISASNAGAEYTLRVTVR
jgi:putative hemolysin